MIITGKNGNTQMKRDVQQLRTAEEKSAALLALSFKAQIVQDRAAGTKIIDDGMILQSAELIEYDSFKDNHAYNTIGEIFKYGDRYFEEFVGSIVLEPADFGSCIVEGYTAVGKHGFYCRQIKFFFVGQAEVVAVIMEYQTHYAPEVVDEVGIVEIHAPSVGLWWKCAHD